MLEKNPPSPNDIINTSFGGIIFGEMTNRAVKGNFKEKGRQEKRNKRTCCICNKPHAGIKPVNGNRILKKPWQPSFGNDPLVALSIRRGSKIYK